MVRLRGSPSRVRFKRITRKSERGEQLWAFAQSPFGIWVLSTVIVGLFGWGYAQIESGLSHSAAKRTLVAHADAEAKSRLEQWAGMSRVRWVRRKFGWKFQEFYFELIESPGSRPAHADSIYPAYSEFANSAFISVLVQLRDNVPAKERSSIDDAISWVGVWNPDTWTDKTFQQAVNITLEHLWLTRWGSRPVIPDIPLFNVTVGGGLIDSQKKFLSAVFPGDKKRKDKDGLFIFSADDGLGPQRWEIETDPRGFSHIRIASGINDDGDFLSAKSDGKLVDLYPVDDKSGRQRWIIEDTTGGFKRIRIDSGVSGNFRYLSTSPNGNHLYLAEADDGSGRQRWKTERIK